MAIRIRDESEQEPRIACATYFDGAVMRTQVQHQAHKFDDVIIDAEGRDSTALADYSQLVYLPNSIFRRKSFANAAGTGLSVFELKP